MATDERATPWSRQQVVQHLRRFGTLGNLIAGLVALSALVLSVIAYFAGLLGPVIAAAQTNDSILYTLGFLAGLTFVTSALALYYLLRYKRGKSLIKIEKEISRDSKDALARHDAIDAIFRAMAHDYSRCDQHLFETLFYDLALGKTERLQSLANATIYIETHIDQILSHTRALFTTLTGHPCTVTVKIIDLEEEAKNNIRKLKIKVYRRDGYTVSSRQYPPQPPTMVVDNTADEHVILGPGGCFANDDLKSLPAGEYKNPNQEWPAAYNATIVCGIDPMHDGHPLIYASGCLCVDNKSGGLNNLTAREYALGISWRLAVLLYRLNRITGKAVHDLKEFNREADR